jgi:hypothetical protein
MASRYERLDVIESNTSATLTMRAAIGIRVPDSLLRIAGSVEILVMQFHDGQQVPESSNLLEYFSTNLRVDLDESKLLGC